MTMPNSNNYNHNFSDYYSFLIEQYKVLSSRRINHNQILWSIPSIFFAAQAILISTSFTQDTNLYTKTIISLISFIFALLVLQIFQKNRAMEISDAEQLIDIENYIKNFGSFKSQGLIVHHKLDKRTYINGSKIQKFLIKNGELTPFNNLSSYSLWNLALIVSAFFSFLLFLYFALMILDPSLVFHSNFKLKGFLFIFISTLMLCINKCFFKAYLLYNKKKYLRKEKNIGKITLVEICVSFILAPTFLASTVTMIFTAIMIAIIFFSQFFTYISFYRKIIGYSVKRN